MMEPKETTAIVERSDEELLTPAQRELEVARALVISTPEQEIDAGAKLRAIATRRRDLEAERLSMTRPLDESKSRIMAKYRGPLSLLDEAQTLYERAIAAHRRKVAQEKAAAQARMEEQARAERERLAKQAAAAEAKGKVERAEVLRETAAAVPSSFIPPPSPRADGVATGEKFSAQVEDLQAVIAFALGIDVELLRNAQAPFRHWVTVDEAAIRAYARSAKRAFSVPGCALMIGDRVSTRSL
jgi:hypothetical protein